MKTLKLIFLICFLVQFQMNASNTDNENVSAHTFSVADANTAYRFSIDGPYTVMPNVSYTFHIVDISGASSVGHYAYRWYVNTNRGWEMVGYNTLSTTSVDIELYSESTYINQGEGKILLKCDAFNTAAGQQHTEYFTPRCVNCKFK